MTNLDMTPRLNKWLAAIGLALWLLSPVMLESGRMIPTISGKIFTAEETK